MNSFFNSVDINSKLDKNIIDIRSSIDFNHGHVENSVNIPYNELLMNYSKYLNKEETYYIYCFTGNISRLVCQHLAKIGYKVVNLTGGYISYKKR